MRYAIIVENDRILVEFSEEDFKKTLEYFYGQSKDINKAFEATKQALINKVRKL